MALTIPDELLQRAGMSGDELLLELAVLLFARGRLTLGQASSALGVSQPEFQKELAKREIPLHYDVADLDGDLQSLRQVGLL